MFERIVSLIVVVGLATPAAAGTPIPAPDIGGGPLGVLAAVAAVYALRLFRRRRK